VESAANEVRAGSTDFWEEGDAGALGEFEKYRIVQDRLFESDFDRMLMALPRSVE
jgi:hypothetical protein